MIFHFQALNIRSYRFPNEHPNIRWRKNKRTSCERSRDHCYKTNFLSTDRFSSFWSGSIGKNINFVAFRSIHQSEFDSVTAERQSCLKVCEHAQFPKSGNKPTSNYHKANRRFEHCAKFLVNFPAGLVMFYLMIVQTGAIVGLGSP